MLVVRIVLQRRWRISESGFDFGGVERLALLISTLHIHVRVENFKPMRPIQEVSDTAALVAAS